LNLLLQLLLVLLLPLKGGLLHLLGGMNLLPLLHLHLLLLHWSLLILDHQLFLVLDLLGEYFLLLLVVHYIYLLLHLNHHLFLLQLFLLQNLRHQRKELLKNWKHYQGMNRRLGDL
tara:strand:- start:146 stop:493 length:348 start_codon:yes stop_codon:yes gene_type:complete